MYMRLGGTRKMQQSNASGFNINNFYNIYSELKDKFIEELEKATKD